MTRHLQQLLDALAALPQQQPYKHYHIPALWVGESSGTVSVDPKRHYSDAIESILARDPHPLQDAGADADTWSRSAAVYNLFARLTTAFDHDGNGTINPDPLQGGFRETGTLLKSIALLPYIKKLGINTVYLLPLTAPGTVNRKGNLGSPYAIKNHFTIDPLLAEPALGLSAETTLKAFVEAAHHLGLRVMFEYVFRTASIDNDWIPQHPDWFYWLYDTPPASADSTPFGPPEFDRDTLNRIYEQGDKHDHQKLPDPPQSYRNRFAPTPERIQQNPDGSYTGITAEGDTCSIASAFSDWPPDDRQPPWTDVTYLKLHRHPGFNYIAYNTIRMYDTLLDNPEARNTELWNAIQGIIPHYQATYGIDGAMIDMGHALPAELKAGIVKKARQADPGFAFWDENFDPSSSAKDEGFNAVFGSFPFVLQDPIYIRGLLNFLSKTGVPLPFFATGENHNTPRVTHNHPGEEGRRRSQFIFALAMMLPAIPFIHSGMEICESHPVNLGLNFTDDDRKRFPAESLPLFSRATYDWKNTNNLSPIHTYITKLLAIRQRYHNIISSGEKGSLVLPFTSSPDMVAVMRKGSRSNLIFVGNSNFKNKIQTTLEFSRETCTTTDLIQGKPLQVERHKLEITLEPGQSVMFEMPH